MAARAIDSGGYFAPSFRNPLSTEGARARIAPSATAKGFYFVAVLRELEQQGHHLERFGPYREFSDYPVASAFTLLIEATRRLYPQEPVREAVRRIAWNMFPALASTMVGRVLFGALGMDVLAVAKLTGRCFEISLSAGRATNLRLEPGLLEIRVTDFPLLPDCFLVGVIEGWFAHYGHDCEVLIRPGGRFEDMDYLVRW